MTTKTRWLLGLALCFLGAGFFVFSQWGTEPAPSPRQAAGVDPAELAAIRGELAELRQMLGTAAAANQATATEAHAADALLSARLDAIETRIDQRSAAAPEPEPVRRPNLAERFKKQKLKLSQTDGLARPSPEGEAMFAADAEATSAVLDERVNAAFGEVTQLYLLEDVHCKQTVCKVAYRPQAGRSDADSTLDMNELLISLSGQMDGGSVSARHAREADGGLIMYLQVR